jgi:hypothetical protein
MKNKELKETTKKSYENSIKRLQNKGIILDGDINLEDMMNKMNDSSLSSKKSNLTAVKWYLENTNDKKYDKTCNEIKEIIKKINKEKKIQDKLIEENFKEIHKSFGEISKLVEKLKNKNLNE